MQNVIFHTKLDLYIDAINQLYIYIYIIMFLAKRCVACLKDIPCTLGRLIRRGSVLEKKLTKVESVIQLMQCDQTFHKYNITEFMLDASRFVHTSYDCNTSA